jgi:hypothetical protein
MSVTETCAVALLVLALSPGPVHARGGDEIQVDTILPDRLEAHASELFRINRLALRDPHIFVEPVPGLPLCVDATDSTDSDLPSFNGVLDAAINGDDNGDGFLDASPLLVLKPRGWPESPGALALVPGACTAPVDTTACKTIEAPVTRWFDNRTDGLCRGPLGGTVSGYDPEVPNIDGPCFATHPAPLTLAIQELPLNLEAATVAGDWSMIGNEIVGPALLRGFLSEKDAEAIVFPEDIEVIGGQTLASLLAGGQGSCAAGSDMDQFGGIDGRWFYFDIEATRPPGGD